MSDATYAKGDMMYLVNTRTSEWTKVKIKRTTKTLIVIERNGQEKKFKKNYVKERNDNNYNTHWHNPEGARDDRGCDDYVLYDSSEGIEKILERRRQRFAISVDEILEIGRQVLAKSVDGKDD